MHCTVPLKWMVGIFWILKQLVVLFFPSLYYKELQPSHASCYEHHIKECEYHWSNHHGLFQTLMFHISQNSWPKINHTTFFPGPDKIALAWLSMPRDLAEFKASRDNNTTRGKSERADIAFKNAWLCIQGFKSCLGIKKTGLVRILFLMNKSNTKLQESSMSNYLAETAENSRVLQQSKMHSWT